MTIPSLMIQGTGSSVGKSRLVTGLCRIFKQDGLSPAPFKSQNMALNSYITHEGLEMGRAQVAQAEACGLEPSVLMNPILLKPRSDKNSQVIIMGRPHGSLSAIDYHAEKPKLLDIVKDSYDKLAKDKDIIIIEGAGSPAEINLRDRDIVNMGMAELVDAPVIIVGDIDRGGVFASFVGTLELLSPEERARVKGVVINKFRGDYELLRPGIKMLEDIIKIPVIGVLPYSDVYIDEEDSSQTEASRLNQRERKLNSNNICIKVLSLPRITNFTDFVPLGEYPDVDISYVTGGRSIGDADMVIIPGAENPRESMEFIRKFGWDKELKHLMQRGTVILGVGTGFFLLSNVMNYRGDTEHIEGLGLLDCEAKIDEEQIPVRVSGRVMSDLSGPAHVLRKTKVEGYQIYSGKVKSNTELKELIKIEKCFDDDVNISEGLVSSTGLVLGTSIHGIFECPDFCSRFLNGLRGIRFGDKAETDISLASIDFQAFKEEQYDRWAKVVRENLDMERIYEIIGVRG